MDFCHLHVHSDYSLLDGTCKVDDLMRSAAERGMSQIALTDHGNMFGAIPFYKAGRKHGVKPIIGCEMYMAPGPRTDRRRDPVTGVSSFHLTLMARNLEGYHNLVKLASTAYLDGFYYNPRIDHAALKEHSEGLLALSGCLKGETSFLLRTGNEKKAYETAEFYREILGENYFVEIQRNGAEGQEENNQALIKMARDLDLPIVCTNDVHYLSREDALAQEIRICISTGKTFDDDKRLKMKSTDFFLKTGDEMLELFKDIPEAVHNTLEIGNRCNLDLPFGEFHLPRFDPPEGYDQDSYFEHICQKGLREHYGPNPSEEARKRLDYEMTVIRKMGFVSYFLITADFIQYAKERDIPVGPGRGSAAGSIVAFCMGITNVDPLRYDLLFERFLNSERVSMPDIDIDFCRDGRAEVIQYVTEKYGGTDNVAQIITFGTLGAKAVIRDVGRVECISLQDIDAIAKKIPTGPGITLQGAIDGDPDLQALRNDPRYKDLFDVSLRLEGMHRHASTHAAGVVVGDGPLKNHVPLYKSGDDVVTQYSMDLLEDIGLLKMDFLGLKTLTVIDKALALIEKQGGARLDFDTMGFGDTPTWEMLQRGEALGVFQLESGGMRDLLKRLQPDRFDDLVAILALYRPGPLQTGMVDSFVDRKHGREDISYLHPALEPLLKDTYGTFVYQEQIMLIAHQFAGFTMNEADGLRKAMGKKKLSVMLKYKQQFVDGCVANDCSQEIAQQIWDVMEQFAKYAFNKSHTCAYAMVSYQTAYLKANHPVEFMAALMTCDMGVTDKVIAYIDECKRMDIEVLPPDVNHSESEFSVEVHEGKKAIRFALAAVKGAGRSGVDAIVEARDGAAEGVESGPYGTLADLCERVDHNAFGKTTAEALIRGGALDELGGHRAQLIAGLDTCLRAAATLQEDRKAGQMNLFGGGGAAAPAAKAEVVLPDVPKWTESERLAQEKEVLGFYMSSHPMARHARILNSFADAGTGELADRGNGQRVIVAGMVGALKTLYPKSGRNQHRKMARFKLEGFDGTVSCVMFSDGYERDAEILLNEAIGLVEASVDLSREEPSLKVDRFIPVEKVFGDLAGMLAIEPPTGEEERAVRVIQDLIRSHPGPTGVLLRLSPVQGFRAVYRIGAGGVAATSDLDRAAVEALGPDAVRWKAKRSTGSGARARRA